MSDGGVLYGTDMPRKSPETFDITNQTAGAVYMEIELRDGDLKFTDADADTDVDDVDVQENYLTITGMTPGAKVSDVTIVAPETTSGKTEDILSFDVTGTDHGLHIEADRELSLEPETTTDTTEFTLCRDENNNVCWDVDLTIETIDTGTQTITNIELTTSKSSGDGGQTHNGEITGGGSKTFYLTELNRGNWKAGGGPGEPTTTTTTVGSITIDPAAQGGDDVAVTVSVDN